ncbi:hypothetical protein [Thiomonas sp.]|uniref:hypothetical protein n=1 Tax=Thiomonas sp. TaxID=2047785 RepID=UPI002626F0FA|nr:hypothetical protein [Thiomonas sp.]
MLNWKSVLGLMMNARNRVRGVGASEGDRELHLTYAAIDQRNAAIARANELAQKEAYAAMLRNMKRIYAQKPGTQMVCTTAVSVLESESAFDASYACDSEAGFTVNSLAQHGWRLVTYSKNYSGMKNLYGQRYYYYSIVVAKR